MRQYLALENLHRLIRTGLDDSVTFARFGLERQSTHSAILQRITISGNISMHTSYLTCMKAQDLPVVSRNPGRCDVHLKNT